MDRLVEPELLDELPATDPAAVRSRGDLRRLNRVMGHAAIMAKAMSATGSIRRPRRIVELGAGDGTFLVRLANTLVKASRPLRQPELSSMAAARLPELGGKPEVYLVDRQALVTPETRAGFERLGWRVQVVQSDVFDWLAQATGPPADLMLANLFLHHFEAARLRTLLDLAALHAKLFVACEPRRSRAVLAAARLTGLLGCHPVTQHDAVISVRAGFMGQELSGAWPVNGNWGLREQRAGLFSHLFVAQRLSG